MTKAEFASKRRFARIRSGRCGNCGKPSTRVSEGGFTICEECTAKAAKYSKDYREVRAETGLCVECGRQDERTISGKALCTSCTARHSEANRKTRVSLVEMGVCTRCHKRDAIPGRRTCQECADELLEYNRARRARVSGGGTHCVQCGKQDERTLSGLTRCAECAARISEGAIIRKKERLSKGLCEQCGKNPVEPYRRKCRECLDKANEYNRSRYLERKAKREAKMEALASTAGEVVETREYTADSKILGCEYRVLEQKHSNGDTSYKVERIAKEVGHDTAGDIPQGL